MKQVTVRVYERRVLLTRDRHLLKYRIVTHGYCIRETNPQRQLVEVLRRFGPLALERFSRCLRCNSDLQQISKAAIEPMLPPRTREHYERFWICRGCERIYWQGSHWTRLVEAVNVALDEARGVVAAAKTTLDSG